MKRLSILTAIILAAAALMASFQNCYACTGITLKAKDGSIVVARTIEWAASDNDCRWVVVPRGHSWKSSSPEEGLAEVSPMYMATWASRWSRTS